MTNDKFSITPFIEEMVQVIKEQMKDESVFRFNVDNVQTIWFFRTHRDKILNYIETSIEKRVRMLIKSTGIYIALLSDCDLCGIKSNLNKFLCEINDLGYKKFKFCPKCGKKLP